MSGGGTDMESKLVDKDGKVPEQRFGPNRRRLGGHLRDLRMVPVDRPRRRLTEVDQQMPAIGDLDRSGCPCVVRLVYSAPRSRLMISTSEWSFNQEANEPEDRTGSGSTIRWRSRSQRIVP